MLVTTHSYSEFAAQERAERSEGEAGLSILAKVDAAISNIMDDTHRVAVRQRIGDDGRYRRDAREQFQARLAEVA